MRPQPLVLPLPGWRPPLDVLGLWRGVSGPALLLSAGPAEAGPLGRFSFLCADPFQTVSWDAWRDAFDPFQALEAVLDPWRCPPVAGFPFAGGAIGWIGYDVRLSVEPTLREAALRPAASDLPAPDLHFGLYGEAIAWDHVSRRWAVVASGAPEKGEAAVRLARERAETMARRALRDLPATGLAAATRPDSRDSGMAEILGSSVTRAGYLAMVRSARELIAAGDVYQVNVSQRLDLAGGDADPVRLLRAAAEHSPAPFSAFLDAGGVQVVCASPERFVKLEDGVAQTRPIKGTRPRGAGIGADAALKEELASSAKDRAENVMIVDLARNDLGRVCAPGTVRVDELCRLESYASVHHLVSTVSGTLAPGAGRADLLRALFPGGSMTGAPKVRALSAIDALEPDRRGLYAGSIGYLSFCGRMDLNIVIRTILLSGGRAQLQVGGGVVADSDPEAEREESLHKAASLRRALAAATRSSAF